MLLPTSKDFKTENNFISVSSIKDINWNSILKDHLLKQVTPYSATSWSLDLLSKFAQPAADNEPYGRLPLCCNGLGEVILISWRENAYCAPHDHGNSNAIVYLLRGHFQERTWENNDDNKYVVKSVKKISAPNIIYSPDGAIHDMRANGSGLSLHFYLPAIDGMKVYDLKRKETLVVTNDSGAWIPQDKSKIISRSTWPS